MTETVWRPGREIELVAGTPAGGGQDRPARALIKALNIRVFDSALYAIADVIEGRADVGAITAVSAVKELAAGISRSRAQGDGDRPRGTGAGEASRP